MAVESATYISQLVQTNPVVGDPVGEGDDHLRMIKEVLKTNFSGVNSSGTTAVTATATEMNLLSGKTALGDAVLANDQSWTGSQRGTAVTDNDGSFDMNGDRTLSVPLPVTLRLRLQILLTVRVGL